jgi:hypothetical protein
MAFGVNQDEWNGNLDLWNNGHIIKSICKGEQGLRGPAALFAIGQTLVFAREDVGQRICVRIPC